MGPDQRIVCRHRWCAEASKPFLNDSVSNSCCFLRTGANAHGWASILLRTGVYESGEPSHKPTVILDDVEQAVHWAIKEESRKEDEANKRADTLE
jgi:hypothetical protein